jgi:hypothetical protein
MYSNMSNVEYIFNPKICLGDQNKSIINQRKIFGINSRTEVRP